MLLYWYPAVWAGIGWRVYNWSYGMGEYFYYTVEGYVVVCYTHYGFDSQLQDIVRNKGLSSILRLLENKEQQQFRTAT